MGMITKRERKEEVYTPLPTLPTLEEKDGQREEGGEGQLYR